MALVHSEFEHLATQTLAVSLLITEMQCLGYIIFENQDNRDAVVHNKRSSHDRKGYGCCETRLQGKVWNFEGPWVEATPKDLYGGVFDRFVKIYGPVTRIIYYPLSHYGFCGTIFLQDSTNN